jgi:hypothetical protein
VTGVEVYEMPTEIAVDYANDTERGYVEVGVVAGEDLTDVYVEDVANTISLRLNIGEMDELIAALQRARETAASNR